MTTELVPDTIDDHDGADEHDGANGHDNGQDGHDDHHGEYHQDMSFQPRANRIGLWLFILSECFLFGAFLSARYFTTGTYQPEELNQFLALILTMVLLLSSISAYLAEVSIKYNYRRRFLFMAIATIIMGLIFMGGVSIELKEASHFFPPDTPFGSSYFMLIGLHAFHVLTGLIGIVIIVFLGFKGHYGSTDYWAVEGVVKYWHFVDLAWVIIYPTLYLF
ncbi:MAG: heme-copper oxidase subunit III [Acidimicrobiia bacterium]|nr:heme-copper oxidase subunit III [Acidimicrobiia bacterium]